MTNPTLTVAAIETLTNIDLEYAKRICACLPFAETGAGIVKTQACMRELIHALTHLPALLAAVGERDEAKNNAKAWELRNGDLHIVFEQERDRLTKQSEMWMHRATTAEARLALVQAECRHSRRLLSQGPRGRIDPGLAKARAAVDAADALGEGRG